MYVEFFLMFLMFILTLADGVCCVWLKYVLMLVSGDGLPEDGDNPVFETLCFKYKKKDG
jgi:hypothetical protein